MTKVVYNACHGGGFGLSAKAVYRYAQIKGITIYPETVNAGTAGFSYVNYWTVPPGERAGKTVSDDDWYSSSLARRAASNKFHKEHQIEPRSIPRDDPALAQVVEEMGTEANGQFADLKVRELEPGTRYRIDEYDGYESVVTVDEYEWIVA